MDSQIQEIKEKLDIVDVVSSYIKLQKTGVNYRAICPFHSEKKPSFFVSPSRQLYTCFGCGRKGDIFTFVQEIEGVEFGDALRILAQRAGVTLKRQNPKIQTARKELYEACELATKFFEKQLATGRLGQKAKAYLLKRGIKEESIEKWRLGFSPDTWDSLLNFLSQKGFSIGQIKRAGLVLESEKGKVYDRFRGRIMFPIFDLNSQVVGFGGRFFGKTDQEETMAKYLNIPNTLLYNKSKILYGLNRAKVPIRKEDACVLVEGYTDVIMSHQAGVENVVAVSGTALTPTHLSLLKRYSNNLISCFDMDIAGDSATKRSIDLAQSQGFNVKVAILSEGKDPADVASESPADWKKAISQAKSILDFYFTNAFSKFDQDSPEGKRKISSMLLPVIRRIQNKIEQSYWVKELARKLSVSEESVEQELRKIPLAQRTEVVNSNQNDNKKNLKDKKSRQEIIEERALSLVLNYPETIKLIKKEDLPIFSTRTGDIIKKLSKKPKDFSKNFNKFDFPEETQEFLNFLALQGEAEQIENTEDQEEKDIENEISVCLEELHSIKIKEELANLLLAIKKAEQEKNLKEVETLSKKFNELTKSLSQ